MTETPTQATQTLENMLCAAAAELSPRAVNALVRHPDAIRAALAATGELLAVETLAPVYESPGRHRNVEQVVAERTIPYEPDEEVLNSSEIAACLGLRSRQSVHDWLRKGKLLGWQTAKRGYLFPTAQLDARNQPIDGLGDIVALFEDAYAAWRWMITPQNALDGDTPLAVLARGERDLVSAAAEGYLQGDYA